ncbi:MAG: dihydrofolate reductase family protein, partial [Robiginitalea sp.]|nr:dihydrofolate reductase family protein [Robiginitalea sp.]
MRKIRLYIAMSLNGKIARADGSVDWLDAIPNPDKTDYGYQAFYREIDTTIQGYSTYQQLLSWGIPFPYPDKKNYVLTRKKNLKNTKDVVFVREEPLLFLRALKQQEGKDIWLIGGGEINTLLLNAGLIDELELFVMPIILPDGIGLFGGIPEETGLRHLKTQSFASG